MSIIESIIENHNDLIHLSMKKVHLSSELMSGISGILTKAVATCNEIEDIQEDNPSIKAFLCIYKNLCKSLLFYIDTEKLAYIDNPLDDKPKKPVNNILAKAKSLNKTTLPKLLKVFSKLPKNFKAVLDGKIKDLEAFMEELRETADKKSDKNIDAWFALYAFTVLSDNTTLAFRESLG